MTIRSRRLLPFLRIAFCTFILLAAGRLTQCPAHAQGASPDYRLGVSDVLAVTVLRHPEMSVEDATVNSAGRVAVPVIGSLYVSGKTLGQVTKEIRTAFLSALRRPEVSVTLKQARPRTFSISGAVDKAGVYEFKPGWRISEALANAGGLTARPEITDATLTRAGERTVTLDVVTLLRDPGSAANKLLAPGDTLRFSARTVQVSIAGQVKTPGVYTVATGSTILEVIALAGGANPTAALGQTSIRRRNSNEAATVDLLDMTPAGQANPTARVQEGDLIVIPEFKSHINVLGAVQKPGTYTLEEKGVLRLADALALAGGLSVAPGVAHIVVTRNQNSGQPITQSIDASALLERNDQKFNEIVQDGDLISVVAVSRKIFITGEVKTPGAYELKEGDSITKLIALAGGTTETAALTHISVQRAGKTTPVDAYAALKQGAALDFPLQDGDFVVVPKNPSRVLVLGAVTKPGPVSIEENTTLRIGEAIALAGGSLDRAKLKEIGIFRNTPAGMKRQVVSLDKMYNGQPGLNQPLQNGDTVYVPAGKQSDSMWNKIANSIPFFGIFR